MRRAVLFLSLMAVTTSGSTAWSSPGFGHDWVRSHPFTLMGLNIYAASLDPAEYRGAGFNALLAWEETALQAGLAAEAGLPWHAHIRPADQGATAALQGQVAAAAAFSGGLGWLLHDEPNRLQMDGIGQAASWIKENYPGMPVYCNAFPSYASPSQLYGDESNPGYSWSQYLEDFIALIAPHVLMYDHYPFKSDGSTSDTFFSDMMTAREKALAHDMPYWTFIQSWANAGSRLPSESDLRMHIFSHLTAGYTGLAYFTYDHWDDGGLLDEAGNPAPLYALAADVNAEVLSLGHSMRFLTSTDVRYVPGETDWPILGVQDNPTPEGISRWSAGAGADPHITNVDVDTSDPARYGPWKNGLIGFFVDDDGRRYFMLTNIWHAADMTAAATSLPLIVSFDDTVDELLMLDRETGAQELVPLAGHRLLVTLPGGTGNLYKYNDGGFPPDGPIPPDEAPEGSDDAEMEADLGGETGPDAGMDGSVDMAADADPDGAEVAADGGEDEGFNGDEGGGCGCS